MDTDRYAPSPEPFADDWRIRQVWLEHKRSVPKAAFVLGRERSTVLRAICRVRWYLSDVYNDKYSEAVALGMPLEDARLHAQQAADYISRTHVET